MPVPVVFIIFNRPEATIQVLDAIRRYRPERLLVIADGPRTARTGEAEICAETRRIIDQGIDWPCQVERCWSEVNLGCRQRVSSGLSWAFSLVDAAIILEDDCLPHREFFLYCEELLEKYRTTELIAYIGGTSSRVLEQQGDASYYFTTYGSIWGWATWRRTWLAYEKLTLHDGIKDVSLILDSAISEYGVRRYWKYIFDRLLVGKINTWDYQLCYLLWQQKMLAVQPNVNLVTNIGCYNGTHTDASGGLDPNADRPTAGIMPLRHPDKIKADQTIDEERMRRSGQTMTWLGYMARRLKSLATSAFARP